MGQRDEDLMGEDTMYENGKEGSIFKSQLLPNLAENQKRWSVLRRSQNARDFVLKKA